VNGLNNVVLSLFKKFVANNYLVVKLVLCNNQQRGMKKEFYIKLFDKFTLNVENPKKYQ